MRTYKRTWERQAGAMPAPGPNWAAPKEKGMLTDAVEVEAEVESDVRGRMGKNGEEAAERLEVQEWHLARKSSSGAPDRSQCPA